MDLSKLPRLSNTPTPTASTPQSGTESTQPLPVPAPTNGPACVYCAAPLRSRARFCDNCGSPVRTERAPVAGVGAEAWISVAIGIFLLAFYPTTLKYGSAAVFHTKFAPYVDPETNEPVDYILYTDGSKVHYRDQITFWSDLAITTFAAALILEGVALVLSRRPIVVLFALLVTVGATVFNLVYFIGTYSKHGLAPISALAVVFGVYIAIFEFNLFLAVRSSAASPTKT